MSKISIIIPVLNEIEMIGSLLRHLVDSSNSKNITEIIVIDGGSSDGTQDIVRDFHSKFKDPKTTLRQAQCDSSGLINPSKLVLLNSPKGRAKQMNIGAKHAKGDILYFLHADSFPPKDFDQHIINEVSKGNNAGCFRMQFDSSHWWLRLASWLTQFSWRACRGGDQSLFITKTLFNEIGGYDESYTIYEDNILINELYKRKQFVVINKKIRTSARLYKKVGVWKLQYHFWAIYVKRWFGASADDMLVYYKKNIS
ncbi:TIGR04283 family arsenosugar biosynthesis glycosyltransferase [Winogradskyella sp.]|uniref:TIGR04283 family arsenosugar biosynthesis glycosyltransferase n=1 Tax=Winogradskyella sp. TaxID=1883156 RepID=UPI0025FBB427|nr:TIGR04283 family arsenosugar biosynthesis glycosyltransferase [Winogradskyella sp.]MCT4629863.1 TIGR04283 family arsenosugar biosynthesis glycosyltransferase [Winogradskyella sp.]